MGFAIQPDEICIPCFARVYIVACQGSGVSIKSRCPDVDKRTPQDPLRKCMSHVQITRWAHCQRQVTFLLNLHIPVQQAHRTNKKRPSGMLLSFRWNLEKHPLPCILHSFQALPAKFSRNPSVNDRWDMGQTGRKSQIMYDFNWI